MKSLIVQAFFYAGAASAPPASAPLPPQLSDMVKCRSEADEQARLRCYDTAIDAVATATSKGNLVIVDREDVRKTRRSLFGFSLPKLPFFRGDDSQEDEQKAIDAKIVAVRGLGYGKYQFDLGENGVWQTTDPAPLAGDPKIGQSVRVSKAALGSYFIRVEGSRAVKGMRIR